MRSRFAVVAAALWLAASLFGRAPYRPVAAAPAQPAPAVTAPAAALSGSYGLARANAVWRYGNRTHCPGQPVASVERPCGSVLVASLDGGLSWRTVSATSRRMIGSVAFATDRKGYMTEVPDTCGDGVGSPCANEILATTDGGASWKRVLAAPDGRVEGLAAPAPALAWAWVVPAALSCQRASARCPLELVRSTRVGGPWRVAYRAERGQAVGALFASLAVDHRMLGWTVAGGDVVLATSSPSISRMRATAGSPFATSARSTTRVARTSSM